MEREEIWEILFCTWAERERPFYVNYVYDELRRQSQNYTAYALSRFLHNLSAGEVMGKLHRKWAALACSLAVEQYLYLRRIVEEDFRKDAVKLCAVDGFPDIFDFKKAEGSHGMRGHQDLNAGGEQGPMARSRAKVSLSLQYVRLATRPLEGTDSAKDRGLGQVLRCFVG